MERQAQYRRIHSRQLQTQQRRKKRNRQRVQVCLGILILLCILSVALHVWNRQDEETQGESAFYENCYIAECEDGTVTLMTPQETKQYKVQNLQEDISDLFADVTIEDGYVTKVSAKKNRIRGKVTAVDASGVTIDGYGTVPFTEQFNIYRNYGLLGAGSVDQIPVNADLTWFYLEGDKICGAVVLEDVNAVEIRVLISTDNYSSYEHEAVTVTCKEDYTVTGSIKSETFQAKEKLTITQATVEEYGDELTITSESQTKGIQICSITRDYGQPTYPGTLYIQKGNQGLHVINQLPLEKYLYYVVPSEMPVGYESEALKAQAVCARTYAYRAVLDEAFGTYGADVDDSVSSQVYNNAKPTAAVKQAVNETYGQVLTKEETPIIAYFFSTSCGYSTDYENEDFIKGTAIGSFAEETGDLSQEDNFRSFICGSGEGGYEKDYAYYRWNVTLSADTVCSQVQAMLGVEIGTLYNITVDSRGVNGAVSQITITGSEQSVTVDNATTIRQLLSTRNATLYLNDGSSVARDSMLPSPFFAVIYENGGFNLYGGGMGHGLGMSQNGAQAMAKLGWTWEQITDYFYNDVSITKLY